MPRKRSTDARGEARQGRPPEHGYAALLGLRTFGPLELSGKVEGGLSYHALDELRRALDVPMARIADLLGIPPRTLARRKDAGRLEPDESDRLLRLSRITALALQLFEGQVDAARGWLFDPQAHLGDRAPIDLARTEVGAREVEALIGRLEHGIPL
jgi:putative toxin-antitoxin system antitoxin component (TIGR02293 family)